jgi:predicted acyl esterase
MRRLKLGITYYFKHASAVVLCCIFSTWMISAQIHVPNGQWDALEDLSTQITVPITMADGTVLMTDVTIPVTSDSLVVNTTILGTTIQLEVIPKGIALVQYPYLNGAANPAPYQTPLIFTRTPYNKRGDIVGRILAILGYSYALQDMRGRYSSGGVYFPMHSDAWAKTPYHPELNHILDPLPTDHISNANKHEDGWESYRFLLDSLKYAFPGLAGYTDLICNGSMGMFGASALGNTQLQLAAAHRIDARGRGMKCLFPIVATGEHYNSTGFNGGVMRQGLVEGWVKGQFQSGLNDAFRDLDTSIYNDLHTSADYNLSTIAEVINQGVDHFTSKRYNNTLAASYPSSIRRGDMDISFAPVDAYGEGDPLGQFSRYSNMNVPTYHLTGWFDIFINGQIDTWKHMKNHVSPDVAGRQKIVIGPWAHQTIGGRTTGDMTYKENVSDLIGIAIDDVDVNQVDVPAIAKSEILSWFRSQLNYNDDFYIGEPVYRVPARSDYQNVAGVGGLRVPAVDYDLSLPQLLDYLTGAAPLPPIPVELRIGVAPFFVYQRIDVPIPILETPLFNTGGQSVPEIEVFDWDTIPDVRFYVIGPVGDGVTENESVGNYWFSSDDFPPNDGIIPFTFYLHADGSIDLSKPKSDEGMLSCVHDPFNCAYSIGGNNMAERTPQNDRESQGQFNLRDTRYAPYSLDHPGVISFESPVFQDSFSFIGQGTMTLFASSTPENALPGEETDTDFFIRLVDVYPDGREFFIVEGAINARSRDYAESLAYGVERLEAAYSNIESGKVYSYIFSLLPMAYTFGKGHKLKVLVQSGNNPRYQINPNIPIQDGDFFRFLPGSNEEYTFNGKTNKARKAQNQVYFSDIFSTMIELPAYKSVPLFDPLSVETVTPAYITSVYPNPATEWIRVTGLKDGSFRMTITSLDGKILCNSYGIGETEMRLPLLESGTYILQINSIERGISETHKLSIVR